MIELNSKFTIEEMQKAKRMRDNFRILRKKELSAILNRGDISKLPNDEQVLIKKLRENVAEEKYFEESEGAEYAEYQENLKKVRAGEKFAQELKERGIENGDELVW
ncbi:MAG: hypothetical protein LBH96_00235 [Candidatus Peribacteria bacterium]|jgi:hypothetical protein|nr:hypothetical protein [Candidatus Peribacteria bacterium]